MGVRGGRGSGRQEVMRDKRVKGDRGSWETGRSGETGWFWETCGFR